MSATNKTPNYNLAVYRDYDVTSYLIDFNGNMEKIDTAMKAISDAITGGDTPLGTPTDFMATSNSASTIRNNQAGSTVALLTITNVVPAQYAVSGNVTVDPSAIADDVFGEIVVAFNGNPTTFSTRFYKTDKPNTYSFNTNINVTQKGFVTLEGRIVSDQNSSMTVSSAYMSLQKLDL